MLRDSPEGQGEILAGGVLGQVIRMSVFQFTGQGGMVKIGCRSSCIRRDSVCETVRTGLPDLVVIFT